MCCLFAFAFPHACFLTRIVLQMKMADSQAELSWVPRCVEAVGNAKSKKPKRAKKGSASPLSELYARSVSAFQLPDRVTRQRKKKKKKLKTTLPRER